MLKLRDIMTTDVVTVSPEATLREAAALLAGRHVTGAPVMSGSKVTGVITANDILTFDAARPSVPTERDNPLDWGEWLEPTVTEKEAAEDEPLGTYFTELWDDAGADVAERIESTASPEWSVLDEHTVDEVMTRQLWRMKPDERVDAAADLMKRMGVHRVLVMDDGKLLGIVSTMDVARAVADHQLTTKQYVFAREADERGE